MGLKRKTVCECSACHKEYMEKATYNDSNNRVTIHIEGNYDDCGSIGRRTWKDDIQLCPKCWEKLEMFLTKDLKLTIHSW